MNGSASATPEADADAVARRRSGRVVRAPTKFAPEPANSAAAKRKRYQETDDAEDGDGLSSDGERSITPDATSDEDHPAPSKRKATRAIRTRKPSLKKPKINGTQPSLTANAARIPSRPKKTVRIEAGEKGTGIFAEIFGSGDASESVAHRWLEKYRQDAASSISDLVNCILQSAGCDLEITSDDIRDPENIPNRLIDLQSTHQEHQITDYPLVARAKFARSFRDLLVGFFQSLVLLLHEMDILYNDHDLMDNIHAWLASMSSSSLRPFRHTATTISLTVQSGLVEVAGMLDRRITAIEQQLQAVKRGKNKAKAAEIQRNLHDANVSRKTCSDAIQSFFDTVFVHRYRDVDPKIRAECVEALGSWIWRLPTVFMEPGYLRYLGWMLSDTHAATRQVVLKQLLRVFKRDAQQLGHFIERFRPRLVEMATMDSEISVRVTAISIIDTLRAAALLEPNEIDAIGKLIFDSEARIRKAVVDFFSACIADFHDGKMQEIGGLETLEEMDDVGEDDFETPRKEWLNLKCLAESLAIYDVQIEGSHPHAAGGDLDAADLMEVVIPDTRISLAAQVLFEKLPEVRTWQILAGYLLFDHTTSTKTGRKTTSNSVEAAFKKAVAPTSEEELMLLDVLTSAIKCSLSQTSEIDKARKKAHRSEAAETRQDISLELTTIIPRLLSKFGAEPETAVVVLRLEHSLNLNVFQQLRQEPSNYEQLLDEICTQIIRHDDRRVLTEATAALLHARQFEALEELTESKLSYLWDTVMNSLRSFAESCELSIRGNLEAAQLRQLCTILFKLSKLASIADFVDALEAEAKSADASAPAIQVLIDIVRRGKYEPLEDDIDDLEDEVVTYAIKTCQFYFMWKTRALAKLLTASIGIPHADLDRLSTRQQAYRRYVIETFSSRAAIDQLRLCATGSLCDFHLTFATLRPLLKNFRPAPNASSQSTAEECERLIKVIEPGLIPELISIFDGAEKTYARKANKEKALNDPADDEDPISDDEVDDEEDDEDLSEEERYAAALKAEKALCELTAKYILVITASLIDERGAMAGKLRRRILRNQTKLGNNFREVVAYLDEEKLKRARKAPAKASSSAKPQKPHANDTAAAQHQQQEEDEEEQRDEFDVFEDAEPEEGSREDLLRRELIEEEIDDYESGLMRPGHDYDDDLGD